jgi:hypothetical protein
MVALGIALFLALFTYGDQMFGWSQQAHDQLQIGLLLSFVLGVISGYKVRD